MTRATYTWTASGPDGSHWHGDAWPRKRATIRACRKAVAEIARDLPARLAADPARVRGEVRMTDPDGRETLIFQCHAASDLRPGHKHLRVIADEL